MMIFAILGLGGGLALVVTGLVIRVRDRDKALAEILELPYHERDVPGESPSESYGPLVKGTVALAGKVVSQFDSKGSLSASLERAHIPLRPGEYVLITAAGSLALAALLLGLTGTWVLAAAGTAVSPLVASMVLKRRITKRRKAFETALPEALTLVASSLSAGHTFLRAIQMMCEEAPEPVAEEFSRLVSETRLGYPVVDALARMAARLGIRDLDWVVQAIRIQQQVGGKLADLLHILADFIRARDEVRREIQVLTAEGRISAWVLTGLAPFMLLAIQFLNPGYMSPMFRGWGLVVLLGTGGMVAFGSFIIFRMTKIEV